MLPTQRLLAFLLLVVPTTAIAQETTALVTHEGKLYQGTTTGLIIRDLASPATAQVHYTRHAPFYTRAAEARGPFLDRPALEHTRPHADLTEVLIEDHDGTDVLAGNHVIGITHDGEGRLWVASRLHGLVRQEGPHTWRHISPPTLCPLSTLVTAQGSVWAVPSCGGAARYTPDGWEGYEGHQSDQGWARSPDAVVHPKGHLLLALDGAGLASHIDQEWTYRNFPQASQQGVQRIAASRSDTWLYAHANGEGGILHIHGNDARWVTVNADVTDLVVHPELGLLVATLEGVFRWRKDTLVAWSEQGGRTLAVAGSTVWLGTFEGLYRIDEEGKATHLSQGFEHVRFRGGADVLAMIHVISVGEHEKYEGEILFQRRDGTCKLVARGPMLLERFTAEPKTVPCEDLDAMFGELEVERWDALDDYDHAESLHTTTVILRVLEPAEGGRWSSLYRTYALDILSEDTIHMHHVEVAYDILQRNGLSAQ